LNDSPHCVGKKIVGTPLKKFRVSSLEFRDSSFEFGVWSLELGISSSEFGVWSFEFGVSSLEFGIWNFEWGVRGWAFDFLILDSDSVNRLKLETRNSELETGIPELETRNPELETGIPELETLASMPSSVVAISTSVPCSSNERHMEMIAWPGPPERSETEGITCSTLITVAARQAVPNLKYLRR
jgi:hypothetical protein